MRKTAFLSVVVASLMAFVSPTFADDHHCDQRCHAHYGGHVCNSDCSDGKHHHSHKCDWRCHPRAVSVTNYVTVTNFVTQVVVQQVTNVVTFYQSETNYVTVDCSAIDLGITDWQLQANHTYSFNVSQTGAKWTRWFVIRATSNQVARTVLPISAVRPVLWQLVDVTPGNPKSAVPPQEPTCMDAVTYLVQARGRAYRVDDKVKP